MKNGFEQELDERFLKDDIGKKTWGVSDGRGVSTLARSVGGDWANSTLYQFEVSLTPEQIVVKLDGSGLLGIKDASFRDGRSSCMASVRTTYSLVA